jgi:hypothetical protein
MVGELAGMPTVTAAAPIAYKRQLLKMTASNDLRHRGIESEARFNQTQSEIANQRRRVAVL